VGLAFARSGMKRSPKHSTSREVMASYALSVAPGVWWKEWLCELFNWEAHGCFVAMRERHQRGPDADADGGGEHRPPDSFHLRCSIGLFYNNHSSCIFDLGHGRSSV
jgi:hypothetical protein